MRSMSKWKVLIADDEYIIRDGIRSCVDWLDFDMEVIGEAEDGEEAIELALEHNIDILLVDLNMPIVNGITAMKTIKKKLPQCHMVVITGYDDFKYAQEAIRIQVEDYLLKPVNPTKLANILTELKNKLEKKEREDNYLELASTQVQKNHEQLSHRFFSDWVEGRLVGDDIEEQLQFLDLPDHPPEGFIMMKWIEGHNFFEEAERQKQLEAIKHLLADNLSNRLHAFFIEKSQFITIFLWKEVPSDLAKKLEIQVQETLDQHINSYVTLIDLSNIVTRYKEAKQELNQHSQFSPLVKQSLDYMQEHYQDPNLTLESMAEKLHVSTVYLSKIIKQDLGASYVKILTDMRLRVAKKLLKNRDLSIREVSERVGYDSQHYFSTIFKKAVGITPKQFKQQM